MFSSRRMGGRIKGRSEREVLTSPSYSKVHSRLLQKAPLHHITPQSGNVLDRRLRTATLIPALLLLARALDEKGVQ